MSFFEAHIFTFLQLMAARTKKPSIHLTRVSGGFLNPPAVLENIKVRRGMKVADFGSGAGYFTIPLARLIGAEGIIYAVDVKKSALEAVKSRARLLGLRTVRYVLGNLEKEKGSGLEAQSMDLVICANILHQAGECGGVIREARRVLKNGGKLAMIEWNNNASFGPAVSRRISRETLIALAEGEGFHLEREFAAGDYHFGLIFSQ